jgi:AAA family ATP:ADP antiporter
METGLACAWRLEKQMSRTRDRRLAAEPAVTGSATGGGLWAGITHVFRSPYLASICLFLFLVQGFGTLLYFQQAEIVSAELADPQSRTRLFAFIDLGAQLLTLVIQLGLAGFVLRQWGVSVALILLPIMYTIGFASLAASPSLAVLVVIVVCGRAVGYGITVPTREVLFTVVAREDKYKSKSFIDTVVLRGGDMAAGQIFGLLTGTLKIAFTTLNLYALPIVALWGLAAWRLGRRQQQLAAAELAKPARHGF